MSICSKGTQILITTINYIVAPNRHSSRSATMWFHPRDDIYHPTKSHAIIKANPKEFVLCSGGQIGVSLKN